MQTEALFSNIAERIQTEIQSTKQEIYVAVAWFTHRELFAALLQKAQSGVKVQLMISNDDINQNAIDFEQLNLGKSAIYRVGDGNMDLMHNKFCVIDGYTVITGSYNWSYKAQKNHENIIITKGDDVLARQFVNQFVALRQMYFGSRQDAQSVDFDLNKVIRRLDILKNYILLEDEEDIAREQDKLSVYQHDELNLIIDSLYTQQYHQAIQLIDEFVQKNKQITVFVDAELTALKFEIRKLEHQLLAYDTEKTELEKLLSDFHHAHTEVLGDCIERLLFLKKQLASNEEEYREAEQDEQTYRKQVIQEREKQIIQLSNEEKRALKQAYRKASQICHPDRVSDEIKNQAQEIFVELNYAYEKNDLQAVQNILKQLQNGVFKAKSDTVNQKDELHAEIATLKAKIAKLEQQICTIKDSESYQEIMQIDDWQQYFADIKVQLQDEIVRLEEML